MKVNSLKYAVVAVITFLIVFLMNYIGSDYPDRMERALMTAGAGVVGLTLGMWFLYKNKDDKNPPENFD